MFEGLEVFVFLVGFVIWLFPPRDCSFCNHIIYHQVLSGMIPANRKLHDDLETF